MSKYNEETLLFDKHVEKNSKKIWTMIKTM